MFLVYHLQHADEPGHPNGRSANHSVEKFFWLSVCHQEHFRVRGLWSGLAAVKTLSDTGLGVVMKEKGAAADARRLWFHKTKDHLGGNGGVGRATATAQHL